MRIVAVKFTLKPEFVEPFLQASLGDARGSVANEPGCYRFDVYRDQNDPNVVCFYEVYADDAAFERHQTMPHFVKWRESWKEEWLAAPTEVIHGRSIFPPDEHWHK
ncbi:MAG: antibiotic biosynthesis monooxygenase [Chloroflexi bacterium]|nr:antibiotic biosynthesis monooxygenase [Chloroflexota bacterium]